MDIRRKTKRAMSQDEISLLVHLIQSHPILTSKETNAVTNKLKDECWASLTDIFNSKSGKIPRTLNQLKFKWDNLKKAARKRASDIGMKNLKTGGGKPDFISPDEILEKVAAVMGSTCCSFILPFDGDGRNDIDLDDADNIEIEDNVIVNIPDEALMRSSTTLKRKMEFSPQAGTLSSNTGQQGANKIFGMTSMSRPLQSKAKRLKDQNDGRLERNLAIAKYYEKKAEKLDVKIKILKLELANKQNNCKK